MPSFDFFQRMGLFAAQSFFDPAMCERVRGNMQSANYTSGTVDEGNGDAVDHRTRSVSMARIPSDLRALVTAQLLAVKPALEAHFTLTLTGCQPPQFLTYRQGDFYRPHQDNMPSNTQIVKDRRVSVVIFLNPVSENPQAGSYGGGSLTFYDLVPGPAGAAIGLPLQGEQGLLIAFSSSLLHSVAAVTHGERYTIATWFF
jgi:predicted 2-oxoglutarate/Fe(II)-dependent dioxygenase YbiX